MGVVTHRTTARIVGAIYVAGFIVGIGGEMLIKSGNSASLGIGAILWLMAAVWDALHGVLMFPILKSYSERLAVGYAAFRIMDATFISIMVMFILLQNIQGSLYAYDIGMMTLGIAGMMLCYTLYVAKLIPRPLAVWGLIGYAILFLGMATEIMGSGWGLMSSLPGGLWELFIGVWLIIKGFNLPEQKHGK